MGGMYVWHMKRKSRPVEMKDILDLLLGLKNNGWKKQIRQEMMTNQKWKWVRGREPKTGYLSE